MATFANIHPFLKREILNCIQHFNNAKECFAALSLTHSQWRPLAQKALRSTTSVNFGGGAFTVTPYRLLRAPEIDLNCINELVINMGAYHHHPQGDRIMREQWDILADAIARRTAPKVLALCLLSNIDIPQTFLSRLHKDCPIRLPLPVSNHAELALLSNNVELLKRVNSVSFHMKIGIGGAWICIEEILECLTSMQNVKKAVVKNFSHPSRKFRYTNTSPVTGKMKLELEELVLFNCLDIEQFFTPHVMVHELRHLGIRVYHGINDLPAELTKLVYLSVQVKLARQEREVGSCNAVRAVILRCPLSHLELTGLVDVVDVQVIHHLSPTLVHLILKGVPTRSHAFSTSDRLRHVLGLIGRHCQGVRKLDVDLGNVKAENMYSYSEELKIISQSFVSLKALHVSMDVDYWCLSQGELMAISQTEKSAPSPRTSRVVDTLKQISRELEGACRRLNPNNHYPVPRLEAFTMVANFTHHIPRLKAMSDGKPLFRRLLGRRRHVAYLRRSNWEVPGARYSYDGLPSREFFNGQTSWRVVDLGFQIRCVDWIGYSESSAISRQVEMDMDVRSIEAFDMTDEYSVDARVMC